jgi:hypothetical protein
MAARTELVAYRAERLQEALRVLAGFESLEDSLPLSHGQVRVLRPVVQSFVTAVLRCG